MMKGSDIGIQEKKAKLFNEQERFTSTDEESIESYYHRFSKLMNDFKRNKHFPEKIASNLKFLNNLQPECSQHVTIVHQTKDLHTADYTQLYDFLKYNQKKVDDLRAERLAKTHDPLALMENSNNPYNYPVFHPDQPSPSTYMQQPLPDNNNYNLQPTFNQNYMQQPMPNPEDIIDPTTAMNMALVLMAKAFKLNYSTPTNNNQRISSKKKKYKKNPLVIGRLLTGYNAVQNVGNQVVQDAVQNQGVQNVHGLGQTKERDGAYSSTQLLIVSKEDAGIQLQAEEFDRWLLAADLTDQLSQIVRDFNLLQTVADESLAKHKALELEIERLLRAVVSQDIMLSKFVYGASTRRCSKLDRNSKASHQISSGSFLNYLEVAFRRNTCFVRTLEGVDLLKGNRSTNLYTINLHELGHRYPQFAHARATSTNSKDEDHEVIKTSLNRITVLLPVTCLIIKDQITGHRISKSNLKRYFDSVGISHQASSVRTPQQNGVVEQRNRTLVEAARTMLIFSRAPLFLWAEAIATACYTQNRFIIHRHSTKHHTSSLTQKTGISFLHVFGALCYPNNDRWMILGSFVQKVDKEIHGAMNVTFDELSADAFDKAIQKPGSKHEFWTNHINGSYCGPSICQRGYDDPAWIESMQEELLQFKRIDVWVLVPTPDNIKPLTLKWLFKNKHDEENTDILVICCTTNRYCVSMDVKTLLAWFAKRRHVRVSHLKVSSIAVQSKPCLQVKKESIGLKQAPRAWYDELSTFLLQNHFFKGTIDPTLFYKTLVDGHLSCYRSTLMICIFGLPHPRAKQPRRTSRRFKKDLSLSRETVIYGSLALRSDSGIVTKRIFQMLTMRDVKTRQEVTSVELNS
ncbi:retrovirus-related pol polyprotein from transposon TNT 1-94 [Tanacetum coccineum]